MPAKAGYDAVVTKLPNAGDAVVEVRKLRGYVLNPEHPRGKHKARLFTSITGLTADGAENLRQELLSAAVAEEAVPGEDDEYGKRYILDFTLNTEVGTALVRSG